jgi:hypothetical protein
MKTLGKRTKLILLAVCILAVILGFVFLVAPPVNVAKMWQDRDVIEDKKRFTPTESVDVAMAMKILTHDPPQMLAPPDKQPPLLLFPPSKEELARLSGN